MTFEPQHATHAEFVMTREERAQAIRQPKVVSHGDPFDETAKPDEDLIIPTMVEYVVPADTYDLLADTAGEVER